MELVHSQKIRGILLVALLIVLGTFAQFSYSFGQGPNNRNVSVDTQVNITGSAPVVTQIFQQSNMVLNAGTISYLTCNSTIRDYNGYADVANVSAVFFHSSSSYGAADNNNTHYSNSSCVAISGQQSGYFTNYSCTFPVNYYALNGTWNCTVDVNDTVNLKTNLTNSTTINPLYALNVTVSLDFGNLSADSYSTNQTANVVNLGNSPINISVYGYGRTAGDNLSFACEQGNLSVNLLHFSSNASQNYTQKQILNSSTRVISGLTVPKSSDANPVINSTYWELYADPTQPAFGQCNGTIVFQANPS